MNEAIINRWNAVVDEEDTVYHLGDFAWGGIDKFLRRLKGHVVILKGSHDKQLGRLEKDSILKIAPLKDEYGNDRTIILCHYAMRSWERSHYATWHLFGHHHGKLPPYGLSFDVGVDCWDFTPISLTEVADKMATLKPNVDFRGKGNPSI